MVSASILCVGGLLLCTEQQTGLSTVGGSVWVSNLSPEKLRLRSNGTSFMSQRDSFTAPPPCVCIYIYNTALCCFHVYKLVITILWSYDIIPCLQMWKPNVETKGKAVPQAQRDLLL